MLALRLLQSVRVLVNACLVDLAFGGLNDRLTEHGLAVLFWSNVAAHGRFGLNLSKCLEWDNGSERPTTLQLAPYTLAGGTA